MRAPVLSLRPLCAPVVHLEAGGAWLLARATPTERGLVCEAPRDALVTDAVRRTGWVRVLVWDAGGTWREQVCRARVDGDAIVILGALAPAIVDVDEPCGAIPRT